MSKPKDIRASVARAYARCVASPSSCENTRPVAKGAAAKLAGYTNGELNELPDEAVTNSFGCGNPLAFSEVKAGDLVLDLGCGAGIDLMLAARKVGPTGRALGIDMTEEMVDKAREVIAQSGLTNVEVRQGLIEDLPVESDSVDWVISNCVINLSPEKDKVFAEIARVLKPGGCMLVSDIVAENLPEVVRNDLGALCSCVAGALSEDEYRAGLLRAGLTDVEVRERIEYSAPQLAALIESDLLADQGEVPCCCSDVSPSASGDFPRSLAHGCIGKVWSAKIFARRPA